MELNDLSSGQYSANKNIRFKTLMLRNKNIRFKTLMLRSDLCNYYSDAYIVVKGTIPVEGDDDDKKKK